MTVSHEVENDSRPTGAEGQDETPLREAATGSMEGSPADQIAAVIEPVVGAMGYELVHLEWHASGTHRRLQVYLDHPDGFALDDCTRLAPIVSNALDAADADPKLPEITRILNGAYTLEVSSPGLDRPLTKRRHFARFVGERATVRTISPLSEDSKQRVFHGRIAGVEPDPAKPDDDRHGIVQLSDDDGSLHRIPLALLRRANLIYEG